MTTKKNELKLERRDQADKTVRAGGVALTPAVNEDYWEYRVRLSDKQAVVGFPKFGTIGIGFAVEEDWNTNFPYSVTTEETFQHIKHNKGDDAIADDDVRKAIDMIRTAAIRDTRRQLNDALGELADARKRGR